MRPAELIEQKRNGGEHDPAELAELILAYARDEVPDYQMAAWCMAVYFRGLTGAETHALTDAMIRSGETLDLGAALGRKVVDKHSTGGVGDKTSIAVGPIVAACGVPLGKMSGRGLGHTGGTLDKLESIPGFRVELDDRGDGRPAAGRRDGDRRPDGRPRPGRQEALRAPGRDGHGGHHPSDRELDHVQEARSRRRRDRPGRQGRGRGVHEDARRRAGAGRADARDRHASGSRGDVPPDRHGPAARPRGRERPRGRRGARHDPGRRACGLHGARAGRAARGSSRTPIWEWTSTREGGAPSRQSPTAARSSATSAGSARRAGTPTRRCSSARPSVGRCPPLGTGSSRASPPSTSAIAALELGAGRRTKADPVDHAVGVLCFAKRGDTVLAGDDLAEVHARDDASAGAGGRGRAGGVRDRRRGAARARHPPRRRRVAAPGRRLTPAGQLV